MARAEGFYFVQVLTCATLVVLATQFTLATIDFSQPIPATTYATIIGKGFSTNYFKSEVPLSRYREQNIIDVLDAGFNNLRLRCRAGLHPPNNDSTFDLFLDDLETVVNASLAHGLIPIVAWINHEAEAVPNETHRVNYVMWWTKVANRLKDMDYRLGLDMVTELGHTGCEPDNYCPNSLSLQPDLYNVWTRDAVTAIRNLPGNNKERMIILASPQKTGEALHLIDPSIYNNDSYMMVEWHVYASGPNKNILSNGKPSAKYWNGTGSEEDKQRVKDHIAAGTNFTNATGIPSYLGAWMMIDNHLGEINQEEANAFGCYFTEQLKINNLSWSMNVLDKFYDTKASEWITTVQDLPPGGTYDINMSMALDHVKACM